MCLQSIPSNNIESCAALKLTVPCVACGHTKRPRSRRFAKKAQSIPAPPQDLHPITRFATKHKKLSGERILRELRLHQCCESIEAVAHVGRARGEPHLHSRGQCNHRCTRRSMTRESASASTRPCSTML